MRFLSSKTLFLRLVPLHHNPISSLLSKFSSSSVTSSFQKRLLYEEESKLVRVLVWWDFENCNLPTDGNVFRVAQAITSAVRINGIKGPVTISAFGDTSQLSRINQEALSATGINLTHVPQGGKNSADRSLITDLMYWVTRNPPPAHLFLISSDRDFASVLHRLRMSNYNILLAGIEEKTPGVLSSAASIMFDWYALVRGENCVGKCFNQPPDGPYNSWYGPYRAPLLDPFATSSSTTTKQQSCSSVRIVECQESSSESSSKVCRPIPKEVVKEMGVVLSLYPKGVSITELREQLRKRNVVFDKDFYGRKNFLRLLLSMPKVLQVVPKGKGVFLIHACVHEWDNDSSLEVSSENPKVVSVEKVHQKVKENDEDVKEESQSQESFQESVMVISQVDGKAKDDPVKENQLALTVTNDVSSSKEKDGFLKKLNRLWFGSPEMELEKCVSGNGDEEKGLVSEGDVLDKYLESQIALSTSIESAKEVKADTEVANGNSASPGLLSRVLKRVKYFLGGNRELSNAAETGTQVDDIFAKDSFWKDVDSFINSPRGFVVVSHSKSREELAKNLKDEGPSSLKPLDVSIMLDLVSLLVSEKKWVKENPSDALPFRVTQFTENGSAVSGLRSVFVNMSKSQWDEADDEVKKSNNNGLSEKPVERSKSEKIADCQKLIKKITEKNPEGYNMGRFTKDFERNFGYHLDYQNLGYSKLRTLIKTMPDARIESGYIVPSSTPTPYEESDSAFEERGPVSKKIHDQQLSDSEDEISDSGTDKEACLKHGGGEKKGDDTESDLLEILGSWETVKDVKKQKKTSKRSSSWDTIKDVKKQNNKSSKSYGILVSLGKKPSGD